MVTPAGKEMLKNTINTVKLHNRILEENEMWRHWYIEKGLTMMVSDDLIRKERAVSAIIEKARRRSKKKKHKEKHKRNKSEKRESRHSSKNDLVKVNSSSDRWDHSGFEELYPETKAAVRNDSSELKRCLKDGTKKHKRSSNNIYLSSDSDSSDSREIWEEFRLFRKRKLKNSGDRVSKFGKYDSDSDQGIGKKHKGNEGTSKKKKCESRHCHHKHERKRTKHKYS